MRTIRRLTAALRPPRNPEGHLLSDHLTSADASGVITVTCPRCSTPLTLSHGDVFLCPGSETPGHRRHLMRCAGNLVTLWDDRSRDLPQDPTHNRDQDKHRRIETHLTRHGRWSDLGRYISSGTLPQDMHPDPSPKETHP